jgi:hypothetical protein
MMFIKPEFMEHENPRVMIVDCKNGRIPAYEKDGKYGTLLYSYGGRDGKANGKQDAGIIKHRF